MVCLMPPGCGGSDEPGHGNVVRLWITHRVIHRRTTELDRRLLGASQPGLIAVGEPTIDKALDKALTNADKVVKRTVDTTTDEIASELQEALKG